MTTVRKSFAAVGLVTALAVTLAACGGSSEDDSNDGGSGTGNAAPAGAEGAELTPMRVMMYPSQVYRLPAVVALEEGIFEEHGLDVEFVDQPSALQGVQAMKATESQVGQHSLATTAQGFQAGDSIKFFCGGLDVIQTTLAAPPDAGFPSTAEGATWQEVLQSLEGKKIGIQTPVGSGVQLLFAEALAEAGVEDVTYVNVGTDMATVRAALSSGSIDVAQVTPPVRQLMASDGSAEPLLYLPEGPTVYKDGFGSGWTTPADYLADNKESLDAYCQAVTEALVMVQDPAEQDLVSGLLAEDVGIPADIAVQVLEDGTYDDFDTNLDVDRVQNSLDMYTQFGMIEAEPPVEAADVAEVVMQP